MSADKKTEKPAARYAYEGLDRLIHERARLSILTSLMAHPQGLVFNELKELCALTDGNLSRQLTQLADASLVEVWKGQKNNRPQTLVRMTEPGRKKFLEYIAQLEAVVNDAITGDQAAARASVRPA